MTAPMRERLLVPSDTLLVFIGLSEIDCETEKSIATDSYKK